MKKTIITLLALTGICYGQDNTIETVWTLDFGSEYADGYQWTGTPENKGTAWDIVAVEGGTQTSGNKRVHFATGVYGSWDTDFQFSVSVTLGDSISASNNWPVIAEIGGNGTYVRFGPYTGMNNTVALDGITKGDNNIVSVAAGGTYELTLTKIGTNVSLAVDGVTTGVGTLADTVSGNITDIVLGGDRWGNYKINSVVHSASWSTISAIPEPTTATLSLLALAGLAARRRRK